MKTKASLPEPLCLNLYNFESAVAQDSPYILTSPRSLEACRKAGLKPVELLYKSLQDYQEDLEGFNSQKIFQLYTIQERDRLGNLDKCRAIRNSLARRKDTNILQENSWPQTNEKVDNSFETSTRKAQLDKENKSRASTVYTSSPSCSEQKSSSISNPTPEVASNRNVYNKRNAVLNLTGGGKETPTSEESDNRKQSASLYPPPAKQRPVRKKKANLNNRLFPATPVFASNLTLGSCSDNSTISSEYTNRPQNRRKTTPLSKDKRITSRDLKHVNKSQKIGRNSPTVKKSASSKDSSKKCTPRESGQIVETINSCDSNNNSRCGFVSSFPKKKQVSFGHLKCTDDLFLSEHDRRILETMSLKKVLERENQEFAYQAHKLWEQDREDRIQLSNAQEIEWKEYVAEKRRVENLRNAKKWEEMKISLRKSQWSLEESLREKDLRAAKMKKQVEERKLMELEDRSLQAAKRRAVVEAANQQMEFEASIWQHSLDREQRQKLEKAEDTRMKQRETYRKRVASANRVEELRHQDRWQQVREETEGALRDLREFCRLRETKAQRKYGEILLNRDIHIKELSVERELKLQQAQRFQDELDHGLEKWQDQVLTLQWEATSRADYNAVRQREVKRQRVGAENRTREMHHNKMMERICQEDEARIDYVRRLISRKEEKMRQMAQNRDMALQESRMQAHATAELREHIRRTLSPETFDRKVARVALEMRVTSRPPTASPTMNRSHIYLG